MGISFGSKSVKPYVGGKEVTEAYVGSQLVYKNEVPPSGGVIFDGSISSLLNPLATNPAGGEFDIAAVSMGKAPNAVLQFQSGGSYNHLCGVKVPTPKGQIKITTSVTTNVLSVYVFNSSGSQTTSIARIYTAGVEAVLGTETGGYVVIAPNPNNGVPISKITIAI